MMETINSSQLRLLYNPQLQSAEMIEKLFVVRQEQFTLLLDNILKEKKNSIPQHYLVIGQRGMGKTTILKRMEVELHKEKYRKQLIPLLYREEQYNVKNLAEFWLNTLDALADSLQSEKYPSGILENIDKTTQALSRKTPEKASNEAYEFLMNICCELHRRPVLLIDNIDIVFNGLDCIGKNKQEQWALRKLLSENGAPIIIGGGITTTDDVAKYEMPFYDFFKIQYLKRLNYEEFIKLLNNHATITNSSATVIASIQKNTSRQKALLELTGGSPRVTVILFDQISKGFSTDINDDLNILADTITPLYKAKFEELSQQQRIIIDAIALNWDAISLKKLAIETRIKNNQLSPQLIRLVDNGWIETTPAYRGKGNAYFISERFFNIYYLIRNSSRRHKDKIYCLSKFLECFYGKDELDTISDTLLQQDICNSEQMRLHLAVSMVKFLKLSKRRKIREKTFETFLNNENLRKEFDFPEKHFLLNKGSLLIGKENYNEAIDCFDKIIVSDEQEKCAWCLKGKSLLKLEKYEEALECFEKITEMQPQEECTWLRKGVLLLDMQRFEEALLCFDKTLEINPKSESALGRKGEMYKELQQYENAIFCFEEILKNNPKNESAWMQKGEIFNELGRPDDALICFDKAIEINPKNEIAWMWKGKILSKSKDYNNAIICFNKCIKLNSLEGVFWYEKGKTLGYLQSFKEAVKSFNEALKLSPNFEPAYFFKGNALCELEHYEEALLCFDKCIELNPKEETFYFKKGNVLEDLERYEDAINCLDESLRLNSENEEYWFVKGRCLFGLQHFEEAIDCFNKAIELNSSCEFNWAYKGMSFELLESYDEALFCYEKAIELNSLIDGLWNSKGMTLTCLSRYEEAIICFEESIRLNSKDADSWNFKGDCLLEMQRYEDAINCYDKAIELNPDNIVFWNNKVYTLIELNRLGEVVDCCNTAIKLDANNYSAMSNKGYALTELKKYDDAAIAYEQSLSVKPKNLFATFSLIFLYRDKLGKMEKAMELFNSIDEQEINQNENKNFACRYYLNRTGFELYNQNMGFAKENLLRAFDILEKENKLATVANEHWWIKFGSVVIKLGYGAWLLGVFDEKGYDVVLSPYYAAILALEIEQKENIEKAEIYLNNRAIEIAEPARSIIDNIKKYMD